MKLVETVEIEFTNEDLKTAIENRASPCFSAMNICNALGGIQTNDWKLNRKFKFSELVAEAKNRGMNPENFECAVEGGRVGETNLYKKYCV